MSEERGSFSGPQFRALVGAYLAEALRPGRNSEGVQVRPLRQIVVPMALLGTWLAFGSRGEIDSFRIRSLFLSSGVLVTLAVLPDPAEAFARRRDVLGHLPVARATGGAARLGFLAVVLALLLVPYATPTLAHVAWRGGIGPGTAVALGCCLFGLAIAGAGLWLSSAYLLAARLGVEAVRRAASLALSVVMVSVALLGSLSLFTERAPSLGTAAPWIEALPTSWFVNWLLPGAGARATTEAAGAAALILLSGTLLLRARPEGVYEQGRRTAVDRAGLAVRAARWLERRQVRGGDAASLALLVVRVASREPIARMRARSLALSLLGVAAVTLFLEGEVLSLAAVAVLGLTAVASGVLDLAMSSDAEAAWSIASAPVGADARVAALRRANLLRSTLVPAALVALLAGWKGSALEGLLFGATYLAVADWLASLTLLLRPREPLATAASVAGGNAMLWLGMPLGFAAMVVFSPVWLFADFPVPFALGAVALYGASLAAFAQGFATWAALRLRAAEARR